MLQIRNIVEKFQTPTQLLYYSHVCSSDGNMWTMLSVVKTKNIGKINDSKSETKWFSMSTNYALLRVKNGIGAVGAKTCPVAMHGTYPQLMWITKVYNLSSGVSFIL